MIFTLVLEIKKITYRKSGNKYYFLNISEAQGHSFPNDIIWHSNYQRYNSVAINSIEIYRERWNVPKH